MMILDIFDVLTMLGGLSLFLFGMNVMGQALERRAGGKFRSMLGKFTTGKVAGLLTGLAVTAVIQSSSATTVMVVGFVNSGLMTLRQAINVIMGANVGTTVTAWILSLSGIDSGNLFVQLLKPSSFTPVLALVGIILYLFCKGGKKKDTGMILLGFATLMFGMDTMSKAVSGLGDLPSFQKLFLLFHNPILGVLAGAILTAVIQSSSASVGILQVLAVTGQITYGTAIPIIMGQNIGTCVTAMLSSVGANKNAKRAAMVHLSFNTIGTLVWLLVFLLIHTFGDLPILDSPVSMWGIAAAHSVFNILCTVLMLPLSGFLEKFVTKIVPDAKKPEAYAELDERLLATPPVALERCRALTAEMAQTAADALKEAILSVQKYSSQLAESSREKEEKTDHYEDILSTYLVKLSAKHLSESSSAQEAELLKIIGDFERIADHAVNLLESAEEMQEKELVLTGAALSELKVLSSAVSEMMDLALAAFLHNDLESAFTAEPLEELIDRLKEQLRSRHILRLQRAECSISAGFVWSDLLTDFERIADHCSNIAACITDISHNNMSLHQSLREIRKDNGAFNQKFQAFAEKYAIGEEH